MANGTVPQPRQELGTLPSSPEPSVLRDTSEGRVLLAFPEARLRHLATFIAGVLERTGADRKEFVTGLLDVIHANNDFLKDIDDPVLVSIGRRPED